MKDRVIGFVCETEILVYFLALLLLDYRYQFLEKHAV